MMTTRDVAVLEFIDNYKVASTSTIAEIFFPSVNTCYRRLQYLAEKNKLKRLRDNINAEYIYFKKLPKQLKHSLMVTDFYRELHKRCEVTTYKIMPVMGDIIPDAIFSYKLNGKTYIGLLEVELSNKGFNYLKYEKFYSSESYKNYLPVMPTIFVVGDNVKLPAESKITYKVINTKFEKFIL